MKSLLINVLMALVVFIAPVKAALIAVLALTALDLVTGLLAANKRGEKITSSGLKRTVVKIMVYELVVLLGFITETYLTGLWVPLTKILGGYIGIVELKSVLRILRTSQVWTSLRL